MYPLLVLFEPRGSSRARLSASREPGGVAAYGCVGTGVAESEEPVLKVGPVALVDGDVPG